MDSQIRQVRASLKAAAPVGLLRWGCSGGAAQVALLRWPSYKVPAQVGLLRWVRGQSVSLKVAAQVESNAVLPLDPAL